MSLTTAAAAVATAATTAVATAVAAANIIKHNSAIDALLKCKELLILLLAGALGKNDPMILEILLHFKEKGRCIDLIISNIERLCVLWKTFSENIGEKNTPKIQKLKHDLSNNWNKTLNVFRGRLTKDSCLKDLLFMNDHHGFYKGCEGEPRIYKDTSTLEPRAEIYQVCKLKEGRIFTDTNVEMQEKILYYLCEVTDPNALVLIQDRKKQFNWNHDYPSQNHFETYFGILIPVSITDPKTEYATGRFTHMNSNNPNVIQHFFGRSFPGYSEVKSILALSTSTHTLTLEDSIRYANFFRFAKLMWSKICQLINSSAQVPESPGNPYAVIRCVRSDPRPCRCETIILKPSSQVLPYQCTACQMELCAFGCGRAHHGGDCVQPPDAASAEFIAETSKNCPGCAVAVYKSEGCNHMTCRCTIQFCYICGLEYNKNIHGRYDEAVTIHHGRLGTDGHPICPQFNNVYY